MSPFNSVNCLIYQISQPAAEYKFHPSRKWRFDFAWPDRLLALEVQGGIWTSGRHVRGASLLKEWEKLNEAATLGWRVMYCQPQDLKSFARFFVLLSQIGRAYNNTTTKENK